MRRQLLHGLLRFGLVFATGLAAYQKMPRTLDDLWSPFIQGAVAALAIWAADRTMVTPRRADDPPGTRYPR